MPYELKSKQISVCGETLTVYQASNLMDIKRSMMIDEAVESWAGREFTGMEEKAQRYLETNLYPTLAACTEGNLPTRDEFVNSVPASEAQDWIASARELNADFFPNLKEQSPEEEAAELEKNE